MKIKIGNYRTYWGSYQLADLLLHIGVSEDKCDKLGEYLSKTKLQDFCEWVYSKRKRNIKIKIHEYDIWSADYTLSFIVLPMLKMIREDKHGAPYVDDEDVPEELRSTNAGPKEHDYDVDSFHFQRWDYVLDEMIFAMECISNSDWEDQFHTGVIDMEFKDCEDNPKFSELVKGPKDTHVFNREGYEKMNERISNGTRLFGRYFRSLWT